MGKQLLLDISGNPRQSSLVDGEGGCDDSVER